MTSISFPRSLPWRPSQARADWWFEALDDRRIDAGGESWRAQVLGIHGEGDDLWIQVARAGNVGHSIVLHITPVVTVEDVVRALRARLGDLSRRHVIHVTHAA